MNLPPDEFEEMFALSQVLVICVIGDPYLYI
jgi:hypothetical protein